MSDERLNQHLETQLRNANSTNHELREQLGDVESRERAARADRAECELAKGMLEKAHATQKAAEDKQQSRGASSQTSSTDCSLPTKKSGSCASGSPERRRKLTDYMLLKIESLPHSTQTTSSHSL
jgi:hypothetical protein